MSNDKWKMWGRNSIQIFEALDINVHFRTCKISSSKSFTHDYQQIGVCMGQTRGFFQPNLTLFKLISQLSSEHSQPIGLVGWLYMVYAS